MSGAVNQTGGLPTLGKLVRQARLNAGLTQTQLGRRIGYSHASISRLENGKQSLRDTGLLRSLSAALGLPPAALGLSDVPVLPGGQRGPDQGAQAPL